MNDEPARSLKQRWDEEDKARDKQEERAQQAFLEEEANKTFAPIEGFLIRLSKVLSAAGASMEIDTTWEHLGERRLRRVAKVISANPLHRLPLDFTINAASYFLPRQGLPISHWDRSAHNGDHRRRGAVSHAASKGGFMRGRKA